MAGNDTALVSRPAIFDAKSQTQNTQIPFAPALDTKSGKSGILAGRSDHMIPPSLFQEEFDLLPNTRSLSLQLYTDRDDAGSHCNMGNMKLALDTMIRWMDQIDEKNRG